MTLHQLFLTIRARFWIIVVIAGLVLLTALAVSLIMPKQYTAEAAVIVDVKSADPIGGSFMPLQMAPGYLATQVDIVGSQRVARRVVELTRMHELPAVQEQWREATEGRGAIEDWLATALRGKLEVRPSRESSVIRIAYSGTDPEFAATIANSFAEAYVDTTLALKVDPAREYASWFDERTQGFREQLETAEQRLSEYEQKHGIIVTEGRLDMETARLVELSTQLVAVQGERADSRSRQSQAAAVESLPEVTQNALISNLKGELARMEAMRQQIGSRVGPNHPEMTRVNAEIASMRSRLASEIERIASSLGTSTLISSAREQEIAEAVREQHELVLELKSHRDQLAVLERDAESARRSYDLVAQRLAQTSLESQTQQTNVSVLNPATAPLFAAGPRTLVTLALGAVVGTLLGIAMALLLEFRDPRLRGTGELVELLDAPLLGVIPESRRLRGPGGGTSITPAV